MALFAPTASSKDPNHVFEIQEVGTTVPCANFMELKLKQMGFGLVEMLKN